MHKAILLGPLLLLIYINIFYSNCVKYILEYTVTADLGTINLIATIANYYADTQLIIAQLHILPVL